MKRIQLIFIALLCALASRGQTMEHVLGQMPDSIVPVMSKNNRLDCIDFFKSKMKSNVSNVYDGKCELLALTGDYALLSPTKKTTVAMKMLASTQGDTICAVVTTVGIPVTDSRVAFYDKGWERFYTSAFLTMPAVSDFIIASDTCDVRRLACARALCRDAGVRAELAANDATLTCSLSLDALAPAERENVLPYVRQNIVLRWNGKVFER